MSDVDKALKVLNLFQKFILNKVIGKKLIQFGLQVTTSGEVRYIFVFEDNAKVVIKSEGLYVDMEWE